MLQISLSWQSFLPNCSHTGVRVLTGGPVKASHQECRVGLVQPPDWPSNYLTNVFTVARARDGTESCRAASLVVMFLVRVRSRFPGS